MAPSEVTAPHREPLMPITRHAAVSMRAPQQWIVFLRVVVGLWFLKSLLTKLTIVLAWGFLPLPGATERWINLMPKLLGRYAAENPIGFYKGFLEQTVIPHGHVFANLTAIGEVAVGLGLTFGFLTVLAAFFGGIQVIFYGMAVQHMSPGQQGFHVMLLAMMIAFVFTRAGRYWGIDGWIRSRYPRSLFARLPFS